MLKRNLAAGLAVGFAAGILSGCGGNSVQPTPPAPGKGALYTLITDAPACDVLSFRITVSGLALTPQGGGAPVSLLPSLRTVKINVAALRDFSTILNLTSVPEGIYEEATFTFAVPQIFTFEPGQSPPFKFLTSQFSNATVKASIQPALKIEKDKVSVLRADFDMLRSLEVDAQGQLTGNITPTLKLTPLTASDSQGFGELDDITGFVRTVTVSSSSQTFIGSFLLQLLSETGPEVSVNLTSTTQLLGVPALNQLLTGSFVEVDGFVDSKGNLVATTVEVEDRAIVEQSKVAFIGFVTSASRDQDGNVTQFDLYVRGEEPELLFDVSLDSIAVVNVSSSTLFQFSSRATNFANLPFDATALAVGQEVVVHGKATRGTPEQPTPSIAADKVYLKPQTIQGNFSQLVQAGSDDRTGAFWMSPCGSILQGARILVLTNNQTVFLDVSGLSGLMPQPTLLVKGLPFFDRQGRVVNGVTVPPGTLVMPAKMIHRLP